MIGGLGLTLDHFLRSRSAFAGEGIAVPKATPRADSVIHIFLPGGLSAQETFDPKPFAPIEYRGAFGTRPTSLDGVLFGDLLKHTAGVADKITICRAMSHGEADHDRGVHNMFTGYRPSPAIQYPSLGSVVSHELGGRNDLPPYVCIPQQPNSHAGTGYLSTRFAPFSIGSDPARKDFQVRDLALPKGVDGPRFARRRRMLDAVNDYFRQLESADSLDAVDRFYHEAYALIGSKKARAAFDLAAEPKKLRAEYGMHSAGQRMLLARRLVEAGVRFVSMTYGSWDMHDKIEAGMKKQLPPFDQAFAALIRDLDRRGRLDRTLVMVTTEFGRSPKINATGGRDHWPRVFSIALAGGGIQRGLVYGSSDPTGNEPEENPLPVEDWAATVYHLLGIDFQGKLLAPGGRPIDIVRGGAVRRDLLI